MNFSRRAFLQFSGFTLAGTMLGKGARKWVLPFEQPYYAADGVEEWELSVCRQCPAGCGIRVRKMDGWAVSVEGNPDCPISRGKLCPRGLSSLQAQYNPSRLLGPVHRTRATGSTGWGTVAWDEAIRAVALKLKEIREQGHANRIVACVESIHGFQAQFLLQFLFSLGSTNIVEYTGLRDPGAAALQQAMTGYRGYPAYDFKNTRFVLSVGTPLLEGWHSPTLVHRWFGEFRQGREERGRFVQAEDRFSPTAAKADEWVPLRSGSESDFLLGLASVLILENLYDHAFVEQHTSGFESWIDEKGNENIGFRELVLNNYSLDRLSEYTGVSSVVFLRIARELTSHRPAVAIAEQLDTTAGARTLWAAQCLNALLGNLTKAGGVLPVRDDFELELENVPLDQSARRSLDDVRLDGSSADLGTLTALPPSALTDTLLSGSPYPVEALLLFSGPPLQFFESRQKIKAALEKVPLIVSFSPYLDEKSMLADWILPDRCPMEKWNDVAVSPEGVPVHAIAPPVMTSLVDVKDVVETIHEIGRQIGGTVAQTTAASNSEGLLKAGASKLFRAQRGQTYGTEFSGDWIAQMEAGGWWDSQQKDFPAFWNQLIRNGGWWDPYYRYEDWKRFFTLASGKMELLPLGMPELWAQRSAIQTTSPSTLQARVVPVFSLDHVTFQLQPFLLETTDSLQRRQWASWAEIHPETAHQWRLKEGERILIQGPSGSISLDVILHPGAQPGHLNIAAGITGIQQADWLTLFGVDAYACLNCPRDSYLHLPLSTRTGVRIQKLGG
jgi:anaerobic selenocysteine-containing dehydrogenase